MIAYGEFDSFEVAAADYGAVVGEYLGGRREAGAIPGDRRRLPTVLNQANRVRSRRGGDRRADSSCVSIMKTFKELEIDAQLYLVEPALPTM